MSSDRGGRDRYNLTISREDAPTLRIYVLYALFCWPTVRPTATFRDAW